MTVVTAVNGVQGTPVCTASWLIIRPPAIGILVSMAARATWSAQSATSPVIASLAIKVIHTSISTYLCNHSNAAAEANYVIIFF